MRKLLTILFFLPLLAGAQVKDTITSNTAIEGYIPCCLTGLSNSAVGRLIYDSVNPADSVKKYQKLAIRDRDSANKYQHKPGWNEHYYKLKKTRLWQINYWMQQKELLDKLKKNGNQ